MYGSPTSHQPRPWIDDRPLARAARGAEGAADRPADVRQDAPDNCGARAVAARIRSLIAQQDAGDVCDAARRLGVPVRHLVQLETTLAGGAECADARAAVEYLLGSVVLRYQASAVWLLTGRNDPDPSAVPPEIAEQLASLCVAVARRVIEEYQASCLTGVAQPPAERGVELRGRREADAR